MTELATSPPPSDEAAHGGRAAGRVSESSVARNAVHLIAGQVALTALSFVLSGALGRVLGPADYGLYFFIVSTTGLAFTVVDWGQSHVLVREIARHRDRTGVFLGSALAIRGALAVLAVLGTAAALWGLGYDARTVGLNALSVVLTVPTTFWFTYGMAFRAHERMEADARVGVFNKVLTLAFVLPTLALGGRLLAVLVAIGAASVAALGYAARSARRLGFGPLRLGGAEGRALLVLGTPLLVMNLLGMGQLYLEPLLLSLLTPEEVLGWYGAARTISNALVMPAQIIASASFPRISRASARADEFRAEFRTAMRPVATLAVLVGAGTWAFAPVAIDLVYGAEKYRGAAPILRAIGPTLSLVFLNIVLSTTVLVAGKANKVTACKGLALVLSASLTFLLVPVAQERFGNGGLGAIAAFGAGEIAMLVVLAVLVPRHMRERVLLLDLLRALGAGALASGGLWLCPWSNPLATIPVFVGVFAAGCFLGGLVTVADVRSWAAALRRRSR